MHYTLKKLKASLYLGFVAVLLGLYGPLIHAEGREWALPRSASGQPDMQGVWFYGTSTPFERSANLGFKQHFSDIEAAAIQQQLHEADRQKQQAINPGLGAPEAGAQIAQEADHNFAISRTNPVRINGQYRTSQIISPSNGRLPTKEGGKDFFETWYADGYGAFDHHELRPVSERCVGPNGGPMAPMVSWFYNANMQIVQTPDYVMILAEMNHDARIIPLNTSLKEDVLPQWMGHSVGRWENDTLIIETKGFRPEQSWFAFRMSEALDVTERFRLVSKDEIVYSYTFSDPKIYTQPVTVEKNIVRRKPGEHILEYACHEGNYSLPGILAGARRLEQEGK